MKHYWAIFLKLNLKNMLTKRELDIKNTYYITLFIWSTMNTKFIYYEGQIYLWW